MEKQTPHCTLSVVNAMIEAENVRSTRSVLMGGEAIGFSFDDIIDVVMALAPIDFYKSMTAHTDHRVWQDVYRPTTSAGEV
jgi:motility quorum-sensing regulator / GCU-specific mRNA interferase toxin